MLCTCKTCCNTFYNVKRNKLGRHAAQNKHVRHIVYDNNNMYSIYNIYSMSHSLPHTLAQAAPAHHHRVTLPSPLSRRRRRRRRFAGGDRRGTGGDAPPPPTRMPGPAAGSNPVRAAGRTTRADGGRAGAGKSWAMGPVTCPVTVTDPVTVIGPDPVTGPVTGPVTVTVIGPATGPLFLFIPDHAGTGGPLAHGRARRRRRPAGRPPPGVCTRPPPPSHTQTQARVLN
jgi:hypothetical protein